MLSSTSSCRNICSEFEQIILLKKNQTNNSLDCIYNSLAFTTHIRYCPVELMNGPASNCQILKIDCLHILLLLFIVFELINNTTQAYSPGERKLNKKQLNL